MEGVRTMNKTKKKEIDCDCTSCLEKKEPNNKNRADWTNGEWKTFMLGKQEAFKEFIKEAKELKHFNKIAEQGKYPDWLRGYETALDAIIEWLEKKCKK